MVVVVVRTMCNVRMSVNGLAPVPSAGLISRDPELVPSEGRFLACPVQPSPNTKARTTIARHAHFTPSPSEEGRRNLFRLLGVGCLGSGS